MAPWGPANDRPGRQGPDGHQHHGAARPRSISHGRAGVPTSTGDGRPTAGGLRADGEEPRCRRRAVRRSSAGRLRRHRLGSRRSPERGHARKSAGGSARYSPRQPASCRGWRPGSATTSTNRRVVWWRRWTSASPLETQTRPVYGFYVRLEGSTLLLVHELAHRGSATRSRSRRWRDIWLNEGFASLDVVDVRRGPRRVVGASSTSEDTTGRSPVATTSGRLEIGDPGPGRHLRRRRSTSAGR